MIWPAYRSHAIIFSMRGLANMFLLWLAPWLGLEPQAAICKLWRALFAATPLLLADLTSVAWSGTRVTRAESTTVRGWPIGRVVQRAFSLFQMNATISAIRGENFENHFRTISVIQLNAFLITLRRKGILDARANMAIYAMLLIFFGGAAYGGTLVWLAQTLISLVVRQAEPSPVQVPNTVRTSVLAIACLSLRVGFNVPKYVVWGCVAGWYSFDPAHWVAWLGVLSIFAGAGCLSWLLCPGITTAGLIRETTTDHPRQRRDYKEHGS
jgi:hypothetical protein